MQNMKNWKKAGNDALTTALVLVAQNYALFDDELTTNAKFKKNIDSPDFWIEIAQALRASVAENISSSDDTEYDAYEETIDDKTIFNYVMSPNNRFELNDVICDTIEEYLKHCGGKRK